MPDLALRSCAALPLALPCPAIPCSRLLQLSHQQLLSAALSTAGACCVHVISRLSFSSWRCAGIGQTCSHDL